jgi:hypothetical protein
MGTHLITRYYHCIKIINNTSGSIATGQLNDCWLLHWDSKGPGGQTSKRFNALGASDAIPMVLLPGLPPPQHRSNYTRCVEHAFTLLLMMLRGYKLVSHPFSRARLWKYFSSRSPVPQHCFQRPHFLYCWQLYQPLTVYLPARAVKFPQLLICSSLLP